MRARQFLLCCLFVLAFASSANSAKSSNLSPGENVIEEASPVLKSESKVETKTVTPAAAEQSSSAAPAKKWEPVGGYEPRKDAELTPEQIARYRDILTKISPDDARGSKQPELHSRGEGGGGGSASRKEGEDDAHGGGQGDGSGSIPFPFLSLPPKPRGIVCPKCDGIYEEMWQLQMSLGDFWSGYNTPYIPSPYVPSQSPSQVLARMQLELSQFCLQQNGYSQLCDSSFIGCYVATANSTQLTDVPGGAVTCDKVPFRELVHTIAAYALNGSNMTVEISLQPLKSPGRLRIELRNSWFIQTAVGIQWAINALPIDFWQALKLGDTMPGPEGSQAPSAPPYPSINEAFNILMVNKTMEYIWSTSTQPWRVGRGGLRRWFRSRKGKQ